MSRCTDTHTYIYQCMDYGCVANVALSTRSPCTFSADWRYLVPLLTESQFASIQPTNFIEFNIFDIFDFAKKKYDVVQRALTQNHVISPHLQDNIILDLLDSSTSRNDLLKIQQTLAPFDNNDYYIFEFYTDGSLIELGTERCSVSCAFAQISDLFDIPH
ncbi:hypothetical protein RhiirA4_469104, partial [Rhizophagus irregularis]